MTVKKRDIRWWVPQLLWILYFFVALFKYMSYIPEVTANIMIMFLGVLSISFCILKKGLNSQWAYIIFVLQYTVWGFIGLIYNGNMDVQELLWPLGFMGIGLLALNFQLSTITTRFILYAYGIFIIMMIIGKGGVSFINLNSSRNGISSDIITYLAMHMIASYQERKSVKIWSALFVMVVCFFGIGRSGITISVLLVGLFIVFRFRNGVAFGRNILILPLISIMVICTAIISYELFSEYINLAISNFKMRGMESTRLIIWGDYWRKTFSHFENILFGSRISGTRYLEFYSSNLHNSFFMLHAKYGLWGLVMVSLLLMKTVSTLLRDRNYYLLIPLFVVFLRMNFDYTNFNSPMDTVIIFFLLYPYYRKGVIVNVVKGKNIKSSNMVYSQ